MNGKDLGSTLLGGEKGKTIERDTSHKEVSLAAF